VVARRHATANGSLMRGQGEAVGRLEPRHYVTVDYHVCASVLPQRSRLNAQEAVLRQPRHVLIPERRLRESRDDARRVATTPSLSPARASAT